MLITHLVVLSPGTNHSFTPAHFTRAENLGSPWPDLIVLQLEIPLDTVMQILKTAKAASVDVLLNPAPAVKLEDDAYQSITHLSMLLS
jgi:ribokinase